MLRILIFFFTRCLTKYPNLHAEVGSIILAICNLENTIRVRLNSPSDESVEF